jgi:hypothetical protein
MQYNATHFCIAVTSKQSKQHSNLLATTAQTTPQPFQHLCIGAMRTTCTTELKNPSFAHQDCCHVRGLGTHLLSVQFMGQCPRWVMESVCVQRSRHRPRHIAAAAAITITIHAERQHAACKCTATTHTTDCGASGSEGIKPATNPHITTHCLKQRFSIKGSCSSTPEY